MPRVEPAPDPGISVSSSLGPHVVGERVVVRRVLHGQTGPTGGPAFTDVLGVVMSWADGVVVVMREDGSTVSIQTADIVSGKPVPPRPPVRQRVSVRAAESHAAAFWPRVDRQSFGEWELRFDPAPTGRPRKRANSCLAIGDPGTSVEAASRTVMDFYAERERPALVQVEADSPHDLALQGIGWVPVGGDAAMLLGSLARASRVIRAGDHNIELAEDGPRAHVTCVENGQVIGSAEAARDGDWLGIHSLLVDAAHRRQRVASSLMDRLLDFGAESGAMTVWLHAETDNTAALAMYESLGFGVHHVCRYLRAPQ